MASITRVGTSIGAAIALTLASSAVCSAQIIVGGRYPAYRYTDRDASVHFDVKPREAAVYIDGYYAGLVDDFDGAFQRLRTSPGGHEITLYLEGYRTHSDRVYLTPDNTLKLRHRMEKLPAGEVAARPPAPPPPPPPPQQPQFQPGDDRDQPGQPGPYPRGPVSRRGPRPPDYPPNAGPDGPDGPPPPQGGAPANAGNRGTLSLSLQPSDAEVLVDGTPWGGPTQERLTIDLSEGRHNLQIRKRGYVGYLTDVQIRPGETTNLEVRLKTQPQ